MKKILILLFIASIVLAFSSCKKEGVYSPKQKIAEIYYQEWYSESDGTNYEYEEDDIELINSWIWDGDKLIKIIHSGGDYVEFFYEGKRMVKAISSWGSLFKFNYDGKYIKTVDYYDDGLLQYTINYEHDGKHISKVSYTYKNEYNYYKNFKRSEKILDILLPQYIVHSMDKITKTNSLSKASHINEYSYTYNFQWENNNIKSSEFIHNYYSATVYAAGEYQIGYNYETWEPIYLDHDTTIVHYENTSLEEITYSYDKKKNPFYESFVGSYISELGSGPFFCQSENNLTNAIIVENYGEEEPGEYNVKAEYQYDGNYPTMQNLWWEFTETDGGVTYTEKEGLKTTFKYK